MGGEREAIDGSPPHPQGVATCNNWTSRLEKMELTSQAVVATSIVFIGHITRLAAACGIHYLRY